MQPLTSKLIFNNSFKEKLTREEAAQLLTNSEREQSFFYEFKFSQLVFSLPLNGPRAKFKTKLSVQPVFFVSVTSRQDIFSL